MIRRGIAFASVLAACTAGKAGERPPLDVELRLGPGTAEPNLFATPDGRVILTWHERTSLHLAVRSAGKWSAPVAVAESEAFFVNWADFPSLVELGDGSWIVHWLQKSAPGTYAYHVNLAMSKDRGVTWSAPFKPHRDASPTEHGFVSMVPWADGAALVWLDGRAMKGEGHDMAGSMSIRATTVDGAGKLGDELLLDDRTCECCQTALARTTHGLVAAYRDKSEDNIRDIAIVRYQNGQWTEPRHVARDNWHFPACPVNGPSLSAKGDTVAIAWFTAANAEHNVKVAFSTDAGATWTAPISVGEERPLGRVDIELISGDVGVVSWLETGRRQAEVRMRRVERSGRIGRSSVVTLSSESRSSGFPRMVRVGDQLIFAWTETGDEGGIRVARYTY